jgi:predicted dehydrogenase
LKPVKLGIIGCGIAARELHLPALKTLQDNFKIVMVCNHTEEKAFQFSNLVGGVPYTLNYKELLKNPEVEAVDIALPIPLNYEVVKNAIRARKHVIVEKPLAENLDQAKKMAAYSKRYRGVLMVAENYRYSPLYRKAGDLIKDGKIGELYGAFWNIFRCHDENNRYSRTAWRINHSYEGGFIMDAGIHNIAALRMLCGEFSSGIAEVECINPGIGKMDSISFLFATANMVKGVFNMYYSARGYSEDRLLLLGTEGSLIVESGERIVLKRQNLPDEEILIKEGSGFVEEFMDFYEAIRNGAKVVSTFQEAYIDMQVMIGAIHSAEGNPR